MKLLIAIPALNEEESIESIISRSLQAKQVIIEQSPVTAVDITVVSDGSTDQTVPIASRYTDQIHLIVFEKNRGYGAAIKEAWRQSDADLLGFLDADGTCDPNFFAPLCRKLDDERADVVLGCRLNEESKMPPIRRLGNTIFAALVTFFSSSHVRDIASGMRVIRKTSLSQLVPLPDGLHFTPAMSARAMMNADLRIFEIDMPYHEREGESKLEVVRDGLRFLRVIFDAAFLYRPARPLLILSVLCFLIAFGLILMPTAYYLQNQAVQEWMIYRFVVSSLIGSTSVLLFCIAYLSRKVVTIALSSSDIKSPDDALTRFFNHSFFWAIPLLLVISGVVLVFPSFIELVSTGATYEHWSRFIVMSFLVFVAVLLLLTRLFEYVLSLVELQVSYLRLHNSAE